MSENTDVIKCSCGYQFKEDEVNELETCPNCKKMFCPDCGNSVTPVSVFPYGYNGSEYSCGKCGVPLA